MDGKLTPLLPHVQARGAGGKLKHTRNTQKMTHYKTDRLDLHLMDCMELMRGYPDKHFELAIVDPPYGIGMSGEGKYKRGKDGVCAQTAYKAFSGSGL